MRRTWCNLGKVFARGPFALSDRMKKLVEWQNGNTMTRSWGEQILLADISDIIQLTYLSIVSPQKQSYPYPSVASHRLCLVFPVRFYRYIRSTCLALPCYYYLPAIDVHLLIPITFRSLPVSFSLRNKSQSHPDLFSLLPLTADLCRAHWRHLRHLTLGTDTPTLGVTAKPSCAFRCWPEGSE
ncbi:hypothetical protein BJ166DRAFT_222451 [Pestalotiopsis sp. NC0098]|nr:hypothetical protein BJ166DRAFT_222451 [Pestalotiopsis sp. NC0098]